jgi:hypothetical protein
MFGRAFLLFTIPLLPLWLSSCASPRSQGGPIDYSLAVGKPFPSEQAKAQQRVSRYLARLSPGKRAQLGQYVAVESTTVPVGEIPGLANRIARGKIQAVNAFGGDTENRMTGSAVFIMVFDAKTGQPATDEGFVVIDTPRKGQPGIFGGYTATYIGTG